MVEVIKFLQRILNTGAIERFARENNIQIPVAQLIQNIVLQIVPVGGNQILNLIQNNIEYFLHTDASEIVYNMQNSGNDFQIKKDLDFNILGQKFTLAGFDNIFQNKIFWAFVLFGIVGIMFLKS